MIPKILNIVWKDLYVTYTDRNLLVIMLATPLALATIISLAFGNFIVGGGDVPLRDIPVVIYNGDAGTVANGQALNQGQLFVDLLVPPADATAAMLDENALYQLTDSTTAASAEAARAAVEAGEATAAILIPADFSASLTISDGRTALIPTRIEVYTNPERPVSANVVRSVVGSISATLATGSVSVAATIDALVQRATTDPTFGIAFGAASLSGNFNPDFTGAFDPAANPITVTQQTVTGQQTSFNPLVFFGAGQAVFFMLFTAMGSAASLLEERRDGTLQRMVVSPTPRGVILFGKLISGLVNCIVQVTLLFLALTIIGSIVSGEITFIWGTNVIGIVATVLAVSLAAAGLAALVMALVRTAETANIVGGVVSMFMGLFGGVFFNVSAIPVLAPISRLTITYWGTDAFNKLSVNQSDILLNLVVLAGMGLLMFGIGLFVISRRLRF